jgi:hypothetical protein
VKLFGQRFLSLGTAAIAAKNTWLARSPERDALTKRSFAIRLGRQPLYACAPWSVQCCRGVGQAKACNDASSHRFRTAEANVPRPPNRHRTLPIGGTNMPIRACLGAVLAAVSGG